MLKWFVLQNEKVSGPFSTDEVKAKAQDGRLEASTLVWGRPKTQWESLNTWLQIASTIVEEETPQVEVQHWHYAVNGDSFGPFSRVELVNEIKSMRNKGEILIWTKGMKAWADLYEFHDLLDEIGMNRREHPRAKIKGTAVVQFDDKSIMAKLKGISPGGFGASDFDSQPAIGQLVSVDIKSNDLNESIRVKAYVQYISESGYIGFKFEGINMEAKAIILDFVKSQKMKSAA